MLRAYGQVDTHRSAMDDHRMLDSAGTMLVSSLLARFGGSLPARARPQTVQSLGTGQGWPRIRCVLRQKTAVAAAFFAAPACVERTRRAGALPVGIYLCHTKSKLQTEVTDPDSPAAENIGRHRFRRHVPATVDGDTEKHKL